jgi:two-component system, cell cycle sensor histidine kinase and response regulator CckA
MKSDVVSALENAGWPALLIDAAAGICHANVAAAGFFGPQINGISVSLSSIWAPGNTLSPEQFLANPNASPAALAALQLKKANGDVVTCNVCVCSQVEGDQKYYLLQVLPATTPAKGSTPGSADAGPAQKQKLEFALQLARTVALDFNNALTGVIGHASLLLGRSEEDHPWRANLVEIEKAAGKAAEIASDLGAFSRQEKASVAPATAGNLNLVLQRLVASFQRGTGEPRITWDVRLEPKLFAARFDEAKVQQALAKIIENGIEALTASGTISIYSRNADLAQATYDGNVQLVPGTYVCVEINDTGRGIAPDVLPRIFEPFFTTKRTGNHRGIGLASVYGIVSNHGGAVSVSSNLGHGTSVRVYLPAQKSVVAHGLAPAELQGKETVMLVDDEQLLLTLGQAVLSAYGYKVLTAQTGQQAIEILARGQPPIDLVVTDMVMPAMSGRELLEILKRNWPAVRVLCTSGYVWPAGQTLPRLYLQKPFTAQDLLAHVRQALTAPVEPS